MNLNLVHNQFKDNVSLLKYASLKREKLSWQCLPLWMLYKNYDIIYFYGNPRVLSNVIWATILKLLGKKVVIWGQYHTAGANKHMEDLRLLWWSLFDYVFLYTESEANQYKIKFPGVKLASGMNNGLNQYEIEQAIGNYSPEKLSQWKIDNGVDDRSIILSCARLEPKNNFGLFLNCLDKLVNEHPDILWCVIGKGEEELKLKQKATDLKLDKHIRWLGAIYEQDKLAPWFLSSKLLVHPGSIGLSLLHAMGYGLPVLTHNNLDMQMPEIAALKDQVNGLLYVDGDQDSLVDKVNSVISGKVDVERISKNAKLTASREYNTEVMSNKLITMNEAIQEY